jgi:hypothetical protein
MPIHLELKDRNTLSHRGQLDQDNHLELVRRTLDQPPSCSDPRSLTDLTHQTDGHQRPRTAARRSVSRHARYRLHTRTARHCHVAATSAVHQL